MVSGQFCFSEGGPVNQREGQIITEYLAVLVESRIKCETTHTSPDILTEIMASRLEPRLQKTPFAAFFGHACVHIILNSPLLSFV